jgi:hypothetical protein
MWLNDCLTPHILCFLQCRGAHSESDASLERVYNMALHNMNRGFRVVIVVERMAQSIALLERTLPTFFKGAMKVSDQVGDANKRHLYMWTGEVSANRCGRTWDGINISVHVDI